MALKEFLILSRPRSGRVDLRDAARRWKRLCHWITAANAGVHGKRWNVDLWMPPRAGMTPWVPKYMPSFWVGFSGFADDLAT